MGLRRIEDADVHGKRVLVRVDFNVPMKDGVVTDATRLMAALPTITWLKREKAKVILLAHFGRPKGQRVPDASLAPVAPALADLMASPVEFAADCFGPEAEAAVQALQPGGVLLLENTRYHAGEEANDPDFAAALAKLGDIYVNDAFSAAHRAHGSTAGVAALLPAYAGLAMQRELDHIGQALNDPRRPVIAIVGGAKVSTKIALLENLVSKVDKLFVGGAMANTFLAAQGHNVGKSLYEADFADTAKAIMEAARTHGCELILPRDLVCAAEFAPNPDTQTVPADAIPANMMALDAGPETVDALADAIDACQTLIWNGPLGAFETPPFETSTVEAAKYAGQRCREGKLIAVAGGGDTVAALNQAGVSGDFTFISTAGGAFLEWMEGKTLPGVEAVTE
ncbi:phosphoglycerate kinase [Hyphobacterium sp. HN65]|uniref:Phosphoglycerate kinase n=1 Tax=Hyphobacterium lacteum TaxID=3116575 RepID=A0ABU7LNZ9_9PROT|nr:phosphoglycerate kinase [Hyphobacterium sp. HN65]